MDVTAINAKISKINMRCRRLPYKKHPQKSQKNITINGKNIKKFRK